MDTETRNRLVERYCGGYGAVVEALEGITDAELDRVSADGSWTARMVVHHLADSEMTSAIRLRRLIAEENPEIIGYDEEEFARRLRYAKRPIAPALEALAAARATTAQILEHLTEADWVRAGTHSDSGAYSVETWLEIYAAHAHDHAEQIMRVRSA